MVTGSWIHPDRSRRSIRSDSQSSPPRPQRSARPGQRPESPHPEVTAQKTDIIKEEQVTMLRRAANLIAAIAVMALAFFGMVKAGGWYLDTEERQVRDGIKDPRTASLPVIERPHDDGRHTR